MAVVLLLDSCGRRMVRSVGPEKAFIIMATGKQLGEEIQMGASSTSPRTQSQGINCEHAYTINARK